MLMPKRVKHRKEHRGRRRGKAYRGGSIKFGEYGLQILEPVWLTNRQIEAGRIALTRNMKRGGKVWISVFPSKPVTAKPTESRMGKGQGAPSKWVAVVRPGRIIYEVAGITEELARESIRLAAHKLPVKTRFVSRESGGLI